MKNLHITLLRAFLAGSSFMFGLMTMGLLAVAISGTIKTWTSGERLTAEDLNTTNSSLKTAIESIPNWTKSGTSAVYNDGNVVINGKISSSVLGTFCGQSAGPTTGNIGGYAAAKAICVTTCGNSNAHMCSGHELFISQQLGITLPTNSWYGSGLRTSVNAINPTTDCDSFTSANAAIYGHFTNGSLAPDVDACNVSYRISCCL